MFDLIPWKDRRDLQQFRREMDNLVDRFFEGWPFRSLLREGEWAPSVDVSQTSKEVIVKAELPGMDPKEIDISLQGNLLTIKGQRKQEKEEDGEDFHRVERSYGSFSRTIRLPAEVQVEQVNATYKDGILRIALPKVKEEPSRKIEIKTG